MTLICLASVFGKRRLSLASSTIFDFLGPTRAARGDDASDVPPDVACCCGDSHGSTAANRRCFDDLRSIMSRCGGSVRLVRLSTYLIHTDKLLAEYIIDIGSWWSRVGVVNTSPSRLMAISMQISLPKSLLFFPSASVRAPSATFATSVFAHISHGGWQTINKSVL